MADQSKRDVFKCLDCEQTGEAEGFCKTCNYHLCGDCYAIHKRPRLMRNHELVGKKEMPKTQTKAETDASYDECTLRCKEHQDILKFYCKAHDLVICSECLNLHHKKCNETPKVADIPNIETEFQACKGKLNDIKKELGDVRTKSEKHMTDIRKHSKASKEEVGKFRKKFNEFSDSLARKVDLDIDGIEKGDDRKMEEIKGNCEKGIKQITELDKNLNALHEAKRNCDLFISIKTSSKVVKETKDMALQDKQRNIITEYNFVAEPRLAEVLHIKSYGSLVDGAGKEVRRGAAEPGPPVKLQRVMQVKVGKIEEQETDVIVNSANLDLKLKQADNTISSAIDGKAGDLAQTSLKLVASGRETKHGDVYDAEPGKLKCRRLYHVILKQYSQDKSCSKLLTDVIQKCLQKASSGGYKSISFPALGTGVLQHPTEMVAKTFLDTVAAFNASNKTSSIEVISIVIMPGNKNDKGEEKHFVFESELTRECGKAGLRKVFALP